MPGAAPEPQRGIQTERSIIWTTDCFLHAAQPISVIAYCLLNDAPYEEPWKELWSLDAPGLIYSRTDEARRTGTEILTNVLSALLIYKVEGCLVGWRGVMIYDS